MRKIPLLLLFLSILPNAGVGIIDGHPAQGESWPWLLSLLNANDPAPYTAHSCAASLIAPGWALTAAHCINAYASFDVLAGTSKLETGSGIRYGVAEIIPHPGFVAPGSAGIDYDNDIALLRLDAEISDLRPVELPGPLFDALPVKAGTPALIRGWGAMAYDNETRRASNFPTTLYESVQPVVSEAECRSIIGAENLSPNMMCAGNFSGAGDSCIGDSGGPMVVPANTDSGFLQISIISWGLGCGDAGTYGVNTRLGKYAKWISDTTCSTSDLPSRPEIESLAYQPDGTVIFRYRGDSDPQLRFRLYYAPAETMSPIRYLDMGSNTEYAGPVPPELELKVAVQSYRGLCNSPFSEIIDV